MLFAWPDDWSKNYEKGERFVSMLRGAVNARKAVMVLKGDKRLPTPLNPVGVGCTSSLPVVFCYRCGCGCGVVGSWCWLQNQSGLCLQSCCRTVVLLLLLASVVPVHRPSRLARVFSARAAVPTAYFAMFFFSVCLAVCLISSVSRLGLLPSCLTCPKPCILPSLFRALCSCPFPA